MFAASSSCCPKAEASPAARKPDAAAASQAARRCDHLQQVGPAYRTVAGQGFRSAEQATAGRQLLSGLQRRGEGRSSPFYARRQYQAQRHVMPPLGHGAGDLLAHLSAHVSEVAGCPVQAVRHLILLPCPVLCPMP